MRLAGPDVVLFAVGALLFGGSMYGLVQSDALGGGSTSAFGAFTVEWAPGEESIDVATFDSEPSKDFAFDVAASKVQLVTVVVDCRHAAGVPPQVSTNVEVTLTPPNGLNETTASGECGQPIEIPVEISPVPQGGLVEADDSAAAAAEAEADQLSDKAVGTWTGSLAFSSAGGGSVPFQLEYSGSVSAVLTTYSASATPVSSK